MEIKKIDFKYTDDVKVINRKQFEEHMKLYEGYVDKINEIDKRLKDDSDPSKANATYSKYRGLKRGETYALNGVILHELYFQNIGGSQKEPDKVLMGYIQRDFGSYDNWKMHFIATAKASRGWTVLAYDCRSDRFRNISLDAHDHGNISYSTPILILDVYEHAYFLQYATNKEEYIKNFMDNIDWNMVSQRITLQ